MKINIISFCNIYFWVSSDTNDACGKEFLTVEETKKDVINKFSNQKIEFKEYIIEEIIK